MECWGHRSSEEGETAGMGPELCQKGRRQEQVWVCDGQEVATLSNGLFFKCLFYFSSFTCQAAEMAFDTHCPQWKNSAFSFKIEHLKSLAKVSLKAVFWFVRTRACWKEKAWAGRCKHKPIKSVSHAVAGGSLRKEAGYDVRVTFPITQEAGEDPSLAKRKP